MKKTLLLLTLALSPALLGAPPATKGTTVKSDVVLPYHILRAGILSEEVSEANKYDKKVMLVLLLNNITAKNKELIESLERDILDSKEVRAFVKERDIHVVSLRRKDPSPRMRHKYGIVVHPADRFGRVGTILVNLKGEMLDHSLVHTLELTPKDYIDKYKELLDHPETYGEGEEDKKESK